MAFPRGTKRRVSERGDGDGQNENHRPSPHRPSNLDMASRIDTSTYSPRGRQQAESPTYRGRGGRGRGRGGRGNRSVTSPVDRRQSLEHSLDGASDPKPSQPPTSQDTTNQQSTQTERKPSQPVLPQNSSKSTSQNANQAALNTQPASSEPVPDTEPLIFHYDRLTDELVQDWGDSSREKVIQQACDAIQRADAAELTLHFMELIRSGLDNRMHPEAAGDTVKAIMEQQSENSDIDVARTFLDALSHTPGLAANNPRLKTLCFSTQIPAETMRLVLEDGLLVALGLVRAQFTRMFIRKQTNILYRQSNYNLLREETEGYSKLMTELFTVSQHDEATSTVVQETFENMKALIGAFDLDAGRVLDVLLDVCASMLIRNHRFFVKLLRVSDYWPQAPAFDEFSILDPDVSSLPLWAHPSHHEPQLYEDEKLKMDKIKSSRDGRFWKSASDLGMQAFFTLGRRTLLTDEEKLKELQSNVNVSSTQSSFLDWIEKTGTLPPKGNSVAAQLLGFKLRFYASEARDKSDIMPPALGFLAAMLIKIGFISLLDLYPHLYPSDDAMETVKEKGLKEREEREEAKRPGAAMNALSRAGALADDTVPAQVSRLRSTNERSSTPSKADPKTESNDAIKGEEGNAEYLPEPPDQKTMLLKNLLLIGALPEALYILGRFPWLMDTIPDLPKYIFRILHHCLSKVYDSSLPTVDGHDIRTVVQYAPEDQIGAKKGVLKVTALEPLRSLKNATLMTDGPTEGIDYRFYWEEWADNVPVCQNVEDVFTLCNTLLNLVGVKIGQDDVLLLKLLRIGKHNLSLDASDANMQRWCDLLKRLLCPALSLSTSNSPLVGALFDLLKLYPTKVRYNIYAEWFGGSTSRLLDIKDSFNLSRYRTRDIMKKVNKKDPFPQARALAKASASSPGVVFDVFINQLEKYDNMIDVVVECADHFTSLSYDVLTWQILNFLGREGRSRVSQTGFLANKWLLALSSFTGKILARYAAMDIRPFIQYVLNQLQRNNYTDLRVLRDVVLNMSGVAPAIDFTDAQLLAMAGGPLLQKLIASESPNKYKGRDHSAKRLMTCLTENKIGAALLITIARQRQVCVFNHDQDESKILSEIFDEITTVFTQFLNMLLMNMSVDEFNDFVPDVVALISDYGLDAGTAFTIHRKGITQRINDYNKEHKLDRFKPQRPSSGKLEAPSDAVMTDAQQDSTNEVLPAETAVAESTDAAKMTNGDIAMSDTTASANFDLNPQANHVMLKDLVERITPVLGPDFESRLSIPFYVTFWQLSLSDLIPPTDVYPDPMKKLLQKKSAIGSDRSDVSIAGVKRRDAEKKAIDDEHERLMQEMKEQLKRYQGVQSRLAHEKELWFENFTGRWNQLNYALLQDCFLPRLVLSPLDSIYVHRLIFFLHSKGAKNFRTMHFFDRLFDSSTLTNLVYQCSTRECENLGRFLSDVLKTFKEWHTSRKEYEKKALGPHKDLPGFAKKMGGGGQVESFLDYEQFRTLLYKWHRNLHDALKKCLEDWEYMHVKNAISTVLRISSQFPAVDWMGKNILAGIQKVIKRESPAAEGEAAKPLSRGDLSTSANSVYGYIQRRTNSWVEPKEFYNAPSKPADTPSAITTQSSSSPEQPRSTQANGAVPMSAISVEDGEVKDTPMQEAPGSTSLSSTSKPIAAEPVVGVATEATGQPATTERSSKADNRTSEKELPLIEEPSSASGSARGQQSTPKATSVSRSEEEEALRKRAMEAIKLRNSARNAIAGSSDQSQRDQGAKPVDTPPTQPATRSSTRNATTEQAPNGPRSQRERQTRHSSFDGRDPHRQQEANTRGPSTRQTADASRPARHSDYGYGRLNHESDINYNQSPRASPRNELPPQPPTRSDRRQVDAPGHMGPPPSREYSHANSRSSHGPPTRHAEQRPNGTQPPLADRSPNVNPERAALIGGAGSVGEYTPSNRNGRNEQGPNGEHSRPAAMEPHSPKRQRYSDQGASIRGRASNPALDTRPSQSNQTPIVSPRNTAPGSDASGVHPSRLGQIEGNTRPPPIQTSAQEPPRRGPPQQAYPPSPANAPSGPRSAGPSSAPSPTGYGPPSGPGQPPNNQFGNRRQFAHMQQTINQSNQNARSSNGGGAQNMSGPSQNGSAPAPPPQRPYQDMSPPSSRGYDSRGPAPYPAGRDGAPREPIPPVRERTLRSDAMAGPPLRDRERERSPDRSGQRQLRERDYPKEYHGERLDRRPQMEAPPPREQQARDYGRRDFGKEYRGPERGPERPDPRELRERQDRMERQERLERPQLRERQSGPDAAARQPYERQQPRRPRELMPEGPAGGRPGREDRLRDYEQEREGPRRGGPPTRRGGRELGTREYQGNEYARGRRG